MGLIELSFYSEFYQTLYYARQLCIKLEKVLTVKVTFLVYFLVGLLSHPKHHPDMSQQHSRKLQQYKVFYAL